VKGTRFSARKVWCLSLRPAPLVRLKFLHDSFKPKIIEVFVRGSRSKPWPSAGQTQSTVGFKVIARSLIRNSCQALFLTADRDLLCRSKFTEISADDRMKILDWIDNRWGSFVFCCDSLRVYSVTAYGLCDDEKVAIFFLSPHRTLRFYDMFGNHANQSTLPDPKPGHLVRLHCTIGRM
jgi:hypothetical protein